MTRSSGISSGAADSAVVEVAHSFQAAFNPCFQPAVPCHPAWLEELLLLMVARNREAGGSEVAAGTSSWLGAAAKRKPWRVRSTSTLAWRRGQRQASFFLFHGAFFPRCFL